MIVSSQHATISGLITPAALRSRGLAILAFAAFGAWGATSALRVVPLPLVKAGYVLVTLITAAMVFAAIGLLRSSQRLTPSVDQFGAPRRRTAGIFTAVFLAELIAINFAALLLTSHHLTPYLTPLIAIIVGLHFYPLARLFHAPHYKLTASAMTLAGVVGVAALMAGYPTLPSIAAVAATCAITLWVTAFAAWRISRQGTG